MRWWRRQKQREEDLERELRSDLELEADEQQETGLSPEDARYAAQRALGNRALVKEKVHDMWRWAALERVAQDVRYALRTLRKNPMFAIAAILILTLGVGANSAIFSLANAVLLRPLPFHDPDRLVILHGENRQIGFDGPASVCDPDFLLWNQQAQSFSGMAAFQGQTANMTGDGPPERVLGSAVTVNFFHLLGRNPILGRSFLPDDSQAGHDNVLLLNDRLWATNFHADRSIIGRSVVLDDRLFTVVGVMPSDFQFPNQADFWTPLTLTGGCSNASDQVIARLRPGTSLAQARSETTVIARRLAQQRHRKSDGWETSVVSLQEQLSANFRPTLLLLLGAVGLVLLIACANVSNLLLARSAARQHEMATRRALGAGRGRIMTQLLTESVCLALIAGSLGILLSFPTQRALASLLPVASNQPVFMAPAIHNAVDGRVLGFVFVISVGCGILFGMIPALQSSGVDPYSALKDSHAVARSASRLPVARNIFIVAEVALTLILLVSAGLLARSFIRLRTTDPGFKPSRLLTATLALPDTRYHDEAQRLTFHRLLLSRLDVVPEVQRAGTVAFGLPFTGAGLRGDIVIEGQPPPPPELIVKKLVVSAGYFSVMNIPLLKGRAFSNHDTERSSPAVIVSASFARQFFLNESAVGKRIDPGFGGSKLYTVVGIVGDVKSPGDGRRARLAIYIPYSQAPRPFLQTFITLIVRTDGDPMRMANAIRHAVRSVDPEIPIFDVASMEQLISRSVAESRMNTVVVGLFATLSLMLATIGIYGVVAYAVTQRTREIGLRLALGATSGQVLALILRRSLGLTLVGVALGVTASLVITRLLANRLYEVRATDPETFVIVTVLLMTVSLLASYIAARRAVRLDPMVALRYE